MTSVIVNTSDLKGGAARAAYRLHRGLIINGQSSFMLVRDKVSSDPFVIKVEPIELHGHMINAIQQKYINKNRTEISNTLFSIPYPGYDLSDLEIIRSADIINLHWIAQQFQSLTTLNKLFKLGKPIVWTLHDQWAFTGGCHYSAGCNKYKNECSNCPQLFEDPYNIANAIFKDKIELFANASITIVTPSHWLADCARESKIFKNLRVEVIPNSLEVDVFKPLPKEHAKQVLGLKKNARTILFGSEFGDEKRKGFRPLIEAITSCYQNIKFKNMAAEGEIIFLTFGKPSSSDSSLSLLKLPIVHLGYINSDDKLCYAYSAADIFILPSLEDNLPNTMLEAMSCGTPVVAFKTGGIPDFVVDGKTGRLAPLNNIQELGRAIVSLILDNEQRKLMGERCRQFIERECTLVQQAKHYSELYKQLIKNPLKICVSNHYSKNSFNTLKVNLDITVGIHFLEVYEKISSAKEKNIAQQEQVHSSAIGENINKEERIRGFIVYILQKLHLYNFVVRHEKLFGKIYHFFINFFLKILRKCPKNS